jgi:hypothetical protein
MEPVVKYNTAGTYNILLVATDAKGQKDTSELALEIREPVQAAFDLASQHCLYDTLEITNNTEGDYSVSYIWIVSNGDTIISNDLQYKFNQTGNFIIKLIAIDSLGCNDTISKQITVIDCSVLSGILTENPACGGAPVESDTLVLITDGVILPDSICTPTVTNMYGEFHFDSLQIASLNDTLLYSIATKSGFPLDSGQQKTIAQWQSESPLSLTLAKVNQEWAERYPGNDTIGGVATAMDIHDNIYVTGSLYQYSTSDVNYVTIKYSPTGTQKWVAVYNTPDSIYSSDNAAAIAVDDSLNVYVAGSTFINGGNYDWVIVKYDSSGTQQWVRTYNGQANNRDVVCSMKLDNNGNIYITGESYNSDNSSSFATLKYSPSGNKLWVARYSAPNRSDFNAPSAIVVDQNDNIYVTGSSDYEHENIFFSTVKYNSSGSQLWATNYSGNNSDINYAYSIALDSSGNVYVTGYSMGNAGVSGYQVFATTIKYNSSGAQQWVNRYNATNTNGDYAYSYAITTDETGTSYIAGQTTTGGSSSDYLLIKYSNDGTQQWVRTYNGELNNNDKAYLIAHDNEGNVFLSGNSLCSSDSSSIYSYTTLKYSADGDKEWTAIYKGTGNGDNYPAALSVSANNNVYVTGSSWNNSIYDLATVKYSQCPAEANNLRIMNPDQNTETPQSKTNDSFVQIIPNPNNGNMQVNYEIHGNTTGIFKVYDITGKKLLSYPLYGGNNTFAITGTTLDKGVYFYQATVESKQIGTGKIVIIK